MQLWLVLGVKLMEINSNLFSRWVYLAKFTIKIKQFLQVKYTNPYQSYC